MTAISHDELVQMLQNHSITPVQYIMNSDYAYDFNVWCEEHCVTPDDDWAEFYMAQVSESVDNS